MSIQWYPGHMLKARKMLAESIPKQDVIIEVLDARMPSASANPVLTELRREKPCIKVLAKSDLADPGVTAAWLRHFESRSREGRVLAIAATTTQPGETKARVLDLCKRLALHPSGPGKSVRAVIVGIPNVGKSTLINTLTGRKVAKVGDEPAVTKGVQQVVLESGIIISDNPGILWPKMDDEIVSYRLALGGAIPDTVLDYENVAYFAAHFLIERYPALLAGRYTLDQVPGEAGALLEAIGRRRGCMRRGGLVDVHKAADILVHDFRNGLLGRISLESPVL